MHASLAHGKVVIEFGRCFGTAEAERLADTLAAFAPLEEITLDFTRVREFHDAAFAVLTRAMATYGTMRVSFRGLNRHQWRMLEYFGVTQGAGAFAPGMTA